jgi:hypothetical protein
MIFKNAQWDGKVTSDQFRLVCDNCGQNLGDHVGARCFHDRHPKACETPLQTQVGGDHYKSLKIQPVEYIHANSIPFIEGNVIKYVTRWRAKNGVKDLEKARHFIDLLIELEKENAQFYKAPAPRFTS